MFSIQETLAKTEPQLKAIEHYMDSRGYYDPHDCTPLLYGGLKRSVQRELSETIRHLTVREFMFKGATTGYGGTAGMNYLIAPVLASKIFTGIAITDKAQAIAADVIDEPQGDTINVATAFTRAYKAGEAGDVTPQNMIVQTGSLVFEKWTAPLVISSDMMEDSSYNLLDLAAKNAGVALAKKANDQLCAILKRVTGTTGIGDKTTAAAGADTTTPAQVATITAQVAAGGVDSLYRPNVLVVTPEAWYDAIATTVAGITLMPAREPQFDFWWGGGLDVVLINSLELGTAIASNRLTDAITIVLEKSLGIVVARKGWMRIENYAHPKEDLMGAVVTSKQGTTELVDAAIGVLTEA